MTPTSEAQTFALKAKFFRGCSDPSRLSILEALRGEPRSVGQLVDATGLSQSGTSNHLACLLDCGLVEREQHGRRAIYRLGDGVERLLAHVDQLLGGPARGVGACSRYENAG